MHKWRWCFCNSKGLFHFKKWSLCPEQHSRANRTCSVAHFWESTWDGNYFSSHSVAVPSSTAKERLDNSCQSPEPSILVLQLIKYWKAFWSCTYQNAVHFRLYSFARCEGRKREEKYRISLKSITKTLHIRISITALQALYLTLNYPTSLWNNSQLFVCRKSPKLNCLLEFLLLVLFHKNSIFKWNTTVTIIPSCNAARMDITTFTVALIQFKCFWLVYL